MTGEQTQRYNWEKVKGKKDQEKDKEEKETNYIATFIIYKKIKLSTVLLLYVPTINFLLYHKLFYCYMWVGDSVASLVQSEWL